MRALVPLALTAALGLAACATQSVPGRGPSVTRAVQQPIRDLSLIRETPAPAVLHAWESPYRAGGQTCPALAIEILSLDAALGPDLADAAKPGSAVSFNGLAADLVGGAVGLPFRGVVRTLTGAEQRDRELRAAVLAGMVRRGFLKGRAQQMGCAPPMSAAAAAAAPTTIRGAEK